MHRDSVRTCVMKVLAVVHPAAAAKAATSWRVIHQGGTGTSAITHMWCCPGLHAAGHNRLAGRGDNPHGRTNPCDLSDFTPLQKSKAMVSATQCVKT